ncbi:hypothetical protein ACH5RR_016587 [Cinchona calisaya]|uniref:Uncharacterized protein n=1 Tax=Cinchona calisaya TaxID=153742 RepID=A0ABD2ZWS8_9GENT
MADHQRTSNSEGGPFQAIGNTERPLSCCLMKAKLKLEGTIIARGLSCFQHKGTEIGGLEIKRQMEMESLKAACKMTSYKHCLKLQFLSPCCGARGIPSNEGPFNRIREALLAAD